MKRKIIAFLRRLWRSRARLFNDLVPVIARHRHPAIVALHNLIHRALLGSPALQPIAGGAFVHGSKALFKINDVGAVLRDISTFLTSAGLPRDVDTAETSTLGTVDKTFIQGLRGASIPLDGNFDPTVDGYLAGLLGAVATPWEYYPQGTGTGLIKYNGSALLTSYGINTDVGDAGKITAELTVTGAVTRTVL